MKYNLEFTTSSSFGKNINITIFGGSHEDHIGVIIEGISFSPDDIDMAKLKTFLARRAPGKNPLATRRNEADEPILFSDCPITYIIKNTDCQRGDYEEISRVPRPGHADYAAYLKYKVRNKNPNADGIFVPNMAGGGPFSGRMTAPLCVAGGIALQLLEKQGIAVAATLVSAGGVSGQDMYKAIENARTQGDSLGALISCQVTGLPPGLGGPMYDGLESLIAPIIFGIPGVKGLSFGEGFNAANLKGSENNDCYGIQNNKIQITTNHAGGILGGISTGAPLCLDVAFKPTPSIRKPQGSIDLVSMKNQTLSTKGRHDPCIGIRGIAPVEAAVALAIIDCLSSP